MKTFGILLSSQFLVLMIFTSHWVNGEESGDIKEEDRSAVKSVAKANALFTSDLYTTLKTSNPNNLIFSPLSLSAVIAMVKAGARGNTSTAIQKGMKFPNDETLFQGYSALLNSLKSNNDFTLEAANRIYSQSGFELKKEFTDILKNKFHAEVEQLEFSKSEIAAKNINGWVEKKTNNKIKDLIGPSDLSALTRLVLINAIYFKGSWKNKFNINETVKADFFTSATKTVKVDMMKLEKDLPYMEIPELDAKAVSIPYKGDRLSMIVILPNAIDGLANMEEKLKTYHLASIPTNLIGREKKVTLSLPRFKLESTINLNEPLTKLGMGTMFSETDADFSGIANTNERLYVSKAVQKAFIEVNEEGSEAAAATGLIIMTRSGSIRYIKEEFKVDHPFLTFIYDNTTESLLFMSTTTEPMPLTTEKSELRSTSSSTPDNNNKSNNNNGFRQQNVNIYIFPFVILMRMLFSLL